MRKGSVSSQLVRLVLLALTEKGVDTSALTESLGPESRASLGRPHRISAERFFKLWRRAERLSGDDAFGLNLGLLSFNHAGGDVLYTAMANCDTVGDALETMCRYHDLAADAVRPRFVKTGDALEITWEVSTGPSVLPRHMAEAVAVSSVLTIRRLTGREVNPGEVWFRHAAPGNTNEHKRIFNCPVFFDRERTVLVYDESIVDMPVVMPDMGLRHTLVTYLEERLQKFREPDTFSARVVRILGSMLPGTPPSLPRVAERMGVSSRTVQGRLREEGISFRELVEGIRRELSVTYLGNPEYSISEVAFLLGYAEQSAFNHAFKRWTGQSPGMFREQIEKKRNNDGNTGSSP